MKKIPITREGEELLKKAVTRGRSVPHHLHEIVEALKKVEKQKPQVTKRMQKRLGKKWREVIPEKKEDKELKQ